jgi:Xaa-Pro aminopeptidase
MQLGESFYRRNVARIAAEMTAAGHEALLLSAPANIAYATGFYFTPTERPLAACIWANGNAALFVPYLEAEAAALGWLGDIRWYPEFPSQPAPEEWMAREAGVTKLALDTANAHAYASLRAAVEEVTLVDVVEQLRAVKQPGELRQIERAVDFADLAVERLYARLTTGATERDLLAAVTDEVDALMRRELRELYPKRGYAIAGAIRSGPRSALPRGMTSDRRLTRGDLVVAEFDANVGGYHAMAGCTFFMGDPLREVVTLVETCLRAQDAAREAAVVGAAANAVDNAARAVFAATGLTDALRHRTGHGVGLEAREAPWLTEHDVTTLAAGMVVTIEPAIYQPGRLGVRNIETIAVGDEGPRVLNQRAIRWRELGARLKEF